MTTVDEILKKHHPYPLWIIADRYGGSYSYGEWTVFWGVDYPDAILGGDCECGEIWEKIRDGAWVQMGDGRGVGTGNTVLEALIAAGRQAGVALPDR